MFGRWLAIIAALAISGTAIAGTLFDAAGDGDVAAVHRLLDAGADVDEPGHNRETPLTAAALAGETEIVALLISRGADVMARNRGGLTPLHAAAYSGSVEAAKLLLDHGAVLEDRKNFSGTTPLIVAAEENRAGVVKLLIERGADVDALDRDGFTALTNAWAKGSVEAVRVLKANGAVCQPVEVLGTEDYRRKCVEAGK
jgi:ankyrin repeat protein